MLYLILVFNVAAFGQDGSTVSGVVTDPSDAFVVGAVIVIENKKFCRTLVSNDGGEFFTQLPPGRYKLRARQPGFVTSAVRDIIVRNDKSIILKFVLLGIRNDINHP